MPTARSTRLDEAQRRLLLGTAVRPDSTAAAPKSDSESGNRALRLVDHVLCGRYGDVLLSPLARGLLGMENSRDSGNTDLTLEQFVSGCVSDYVKTGLLSADIVASETDEAWRQLEVLVVGVAALFSFLQSAWTGPQLPFVAEDLIPSAFKGREANAVLLSQLSCDGEDVYTLTPVPSLLVFARAILLGDAALDVAAKSATEFVRQADSEEGEFWRHGLVPANPADGPRRVNKPDWNPQNLDWTEARFPTLWSATWWAARCLFVHQRILDNGAAKLHDVTVTLHARASERLASGIWEAVNGNELVSRLELERGLFHHWYREDRRAKAHFEAAQAASGLKWNLTGALGKRTKFQVNDVTQLVIVAESIPPPEGDGAKEEGREDGSKQKPLPDALSLNDDTLLEKIQLSNDSLVSNLQVVDQTILLAFCLNVKNTNPADGLTAEQMSPYVTRVLENANNWLVHTMALLLRSRLEANKSRTMERSCLQIQALVDQIHTDESSAQERLLHFFGLHYPSRWELERELGERFMAVGAVKSALEIFTRLQLWEDVIACNQMLGESEKAERLVLELLEKDPDSPKLICILADIRRDPDLYEKAWRVSGNRYARAMRTLGNLLFHNNQFRKSVEALDKALAINPLFENAWYVMGCAAMKDGDWPTATRAFSKVVSLDHDNGEAWNNLASVHVRAGRKVDAFHALRMALKQKFDSWRIWQNYLLVSLDVCDFLEAIRAMSRLVELRWNSEGERCIDAECLGILVDAVARGLQDAHGLPAEKIAPYLDRLMCDQVAPKVATRPDILRVLARFYAQSDRPREALEAYEKAYRALVNDPFLERDEKAFKAAAGGALELAEAYANYGPRQVEGCGDAPSLVCKEWQYRTRNMFRSLISRSKAVFEGTVEYKRLVEAMARLVSP